MSSKSRKRDSKGGLRDDPSESAKRSGEEAALREGALVDTLGASEDGAIERLLDESATMGYQMRAERDKSGRGDFEGSVDSQCREALRGRADDIGGSAVEVLREQDSQHSGRCGEMSGRVEGGAAPMADTSPPVSGLRRTLLEASRRQAFEECRHYLATTCQKKELRFEELGEVLLEALKVQEQTYARCSEAKGDLFPLPLPSTLETSGSPLFCADALVQALNSLYGTRTIKRNREDSTRLKLVERLKKVVDEAELGGREVPDIGFGDFFKSRSVDYSGEIVQVARRFDWRMIEAAFPEAVGSLCLEEFCEGERWLMSSISKISFCRPRISTWERRQALWSRPATGPKCARDC